MRSVGKVSVSTGDSIRVDVYLYKGGLKNIQTAIQRATRKLVADGISKVSPNFGSGSYNYTGIIISSSQSGCVPVSISVKVILNKRLK